MSNRSNAYLPRPVITFPTTSIVPKIVLIILNIVSPLSSFLDYRLRTAEHSAHLKNLQ